MAARATYTRQVDADSKLVDADTRYFNISQIRSTAGVDTYLNVLVGVVIFCYGLSAPSANHKATRKLPMVAGAASGVMRFQQMALGAAASALVALLQPTHQPAFVMSFLMAGFGVTASCIDLRQLRCDHVQHIASAGATEQTVATSEGTEAERLATW